jgi:hypothetical protein
MVRVAAIVVIVMLSQVVPSAIAQEYSPRVVSEHNADVYSLKTFLEFDRWRDLTGDARTWEIYQYLVSPRTGLYPLGTDVREGPESLPEYALVQDPVKIINTYGYGFCSILGPVIAAVFDGNGVGKSRTIDLPQFEHVAAETFYEGTWHYLDLDLRAVFRRPDGSLASFADAQRDPALWTAQNPVFFPSDAVDAMHRNFENATPHHRTHVAPIGHTMDYVLRQGESFTRWWTPQGERWNDLEAYHQVPFFKALFEQEPLGPKSKHQGWTVYTHGNGRFIYRPNLTDRSSDFDNGVYDAVNVRPSANGLTLTKPGEGFAIFEVRSPYVIVPSIGKMDTREDDRDASVIEINAVDVALSVSLDNGISWTTVALKSGRADVTNLVSGRYGYLLKIALTGETNRSLVRSLTVTTWVQVAPASLPSLRSGANRMEYRTGDHYGLKTRVTEISSRGADFLKYLQDRPGDFDATRQTSRAKGSFTVKLEAPPNHKIAWFSAGGSFRTEQQADASHTRNSMAYAVGTPANFTTFYQATVPADQDHWHYNEDREVRLAEPAQTVYLRYVGDPAVNNIRIYTHSVPDRPLSSAPVTITHVWSENGATKSRTVTMTAPGSYNVNTGAAPPVDQSIDISIASVTRSR